MDKYNFVVQIIREEIHRDIICSVTTKAMANFF
jgi:hypothetical protein